MRQSRHAQHRRGARAERRAPNQGADSGGKASGSGAKLALTIQGRTDFSELPSAPTLRRWCALAASGETHITLRFVGSREGRRINRLFRGQDHATNVLTFVYARRPITADLVLCIPVIRREARAQSKPLQAHLAHLVLHGMLHAAGHDHEHLAQARRMERREITLLSRLGIPNPYE